MAEIQRGLIGMLLFDFTAEYLPQMMVCLSRAINNIPNCEVDLFYCFRQKDKVVVENMTYSTPSNIKQSFSLEVKYEEIPMYGTFIMPPEIVSQQRNVIREFAIKNNYDWLFFLDMAVCLNPDTLKKLLKTNKEFISVPYRTDPWPHPCIFFSDKNGKDILMYNPHKLYTNEVAYPCAAIEIGASLIRRSLFHYPFELYTYKFDPILGELQLTESQYGYCVTIRNKAKKKCYFLTNHFIENLVQVGSQNGFAFITDDYPLYLTSKDTWAVSKDNWLIMSRDSSNFRNKECD